MFRRHFTQRGSAIIFAMGFLVVVLIITVASVSFVQSQLRSSATARQRVTAEYLAEGGLNQAVAWFAAYVMPQQGFTASVPVTWATPTAGPVQLPGNHPDSYIDAVGTPRSGVKSGTPGPGTGYNSYFNSQSTNGYSVVASLMSQNPEIWELISTGQSAATQRQAGAIIFRQSNPGLFNNGFFGINGVAIHGNGTVTGNVGSNGTISLDGNATVSGNAIAGPGYTPTVTANAKVTGTSGSETSLRVLPTIAVPTPVSAPTELGAASVSANGNATYSSPPYHATSITVGGNGYMTFNGSTNPAQPSTLFVDGTIYVTGNTTLNLNGSWIVVAGTVKVDSNAGVVLGGTTPSTTIYVNTDFSVGGNGFSNATGSAKNLIVYDTSTTDTINLAGNSAFVGALYAPGATLNLNGNSGYSGSFIAQTVNWAGNSNATYDQSLANVGTTLGSFRLIMQWLVPSS